MASMIKKKLQCLNIYLLKYQITITLVYPYFFNKTILSNIYV